MKSLKLAHKHEIEGRFDEAIRVYKELSIEAPGLKKICDIGIARLQKKCSTDSMAIAYHAEESVKIAKLDSVLNSAETIKNISDFAKDYVDPELLLPSIQGEGNNYSYIENVALQLLKSDEVWEQKKVSIIIVGYERGNLLRNALSCLISQTYPKELYEVIVVDDGSTVDDYESIFNEFSSELTLYLVRQPHNTCGFSQARNLGARAARGDVLFFLDSGLLLPNDFLRYLMAHHHISENCSVLGITCTVDSGSFCSRIQLDTIVNNKGYAVDWRAPDFERNDWLKQACDPFSSFDSANASVSRKRFFEVEGYEETFQCLDGEDQEFAYRLWSRGQYFIPLKNIFAYHETEPIKLHNQTCIIDANKETNRQLIDRCPHFSVRAPGRANEGFTIPLFSIYVPAYNVEDYIDECIESALKQTYRDFEVVIVNDGSTDSTWELLQKYRFNPKVKLLNRENGGIGSASNYAIRQAMGEYVVQLDSDDILHPNALEELAEYFRSNPLVECVYTNHELINDQSQTIGQGWSPPHFDRYENLVGMCVPHMRAFRRALFHRTIGFDESLLNAVDYDFFLKLSSVASIEYLPRTLYKYRIHNLQTSSALSEAQVKNHELVVTQYLANIGRDDFYAKTFNPFEPRSNFIVKKKSAFESAVSKRVFQQPPVPGLEMPKPSCPGNDYTEIQEFVREYYSSNDKSYTEKVSIVVPVYNRAERLSRCLAGICQQTYPRELIEVVVVDDGSSDNVIDVVNKYNKKLNLKYLKQHDSGYRLSAARNLGIRAASNRNISIIDCDLIPLPNFIESFMQYLHHYDNVVLLGHQRFVDPTGISDDDILADVSVLKLMKDIKSENSTMQDTPDGITKDWRYKLYEETDYLKNDEYPYRAFSSGHIAYRRKVIEDAGFYDEEFNVWGCEDNEAGYRIYQKGYYFIPVLEAVDLHQEPPTGKNETNREMDRLISRDLLESKLPAMRGWFGKPYKAKLGDVPLVSVCIPVHNTGNFAVLAVKSVLNQSHNDLEVIVYDDASTDGTLHKLKAHFDSDHRVRIIEGKVHKNVAYARNRLINEAKGEFVGFLDSDDLLKPDCLEKCVKKFRSSPNVGLVCTGYETIDEEGNLTGLGWTPEKFDRHALMFGNIFTHFRIFRIRDWNRSRKWIKYELDNYLYGEDWDLCLKLAEVADFARVNMPLYQYRIRSTSITNSNDSKFKFNQTAAVARAWLTTLGLSHLKIVHRDKRNSSSIGYF